MDDGARLQPSHLLRCQCLYINSPHELSVEDVAIGEIDAHDVLVQVGFGGICGSDLHYYHEGGFGTVRIKRPMILGHEVAGTIAAVGSAVTRLKVGDAVAVNPSLPCARCAYCLEGLPTHCLDMRFFGSAMRDPHVDGAFRSLLRCEAKRCEIVAPHVKLEHAALAEPFSVVLHAVRRVGSLLGKRVLVTGCGPIGSLSVAAAKIHGAADVVAVDLTDYTLSIAKAMGANRTINGRTDPQWTTEFSANKGTFDVLIECSGNERAFRTGLEVVRPRATVVQLGLGGDINIPQNTIVAKELTILGSFRFHEEFALAVQLINDGRIDMTPMVSRKYSLKEARAAFELASDRERAMKVLLDFA
jgi:L-idonate 5-dehydrogenase